MRDVDWVDEGGDPSQPTVVIEAAGDSADVVRERLSGPDSSMLDAGGTDVAFRLLAPLDETDDAEGVVSVTDRVTGDFVLELNEDADDVLPFIRAARRYGEHTEGDGQYRVVIRVDGEELVTYEKNTLLVYNDEGELLRKQSLIPGGVEL